jgi:hypothetical protein
VQANRCGSEKSSIKVGKDLQGWCARKWCKSFMADGGWPLQLDVSA